MPAASDKGSSSRARSRGRATANGTSGAPKSRSTSRSRPTKQAAAQPTKQAAAQSRSARQTGNGARESATAAASANGGSPRHSTRETITSIGIPVVTATLGAVGGVLLGRNAMQRHRKVLGVSLPGKIDLSGMTQQIGEAGRQFGKLASEVRAVREKAEQVGRVIS